ncbi:DUF1398 family protein [Streptomyces sp. NPDC059909]|uniref:DUF1398 family protein n=1 Tax=Streptomyces sp. NPDC059909 TaxID=3346998 RepID=UPI0036625516
MRSSPAASNTSATSAITNPQRALERAAAVRPEVGGFPSSPNPCARPESAAAAWPCRRTRCRTSPTPGHVAVQGEPLVTGSVDIAPFDRQALIAALRAGQGGETTFPEFVHGCRKAGVLRYDVDLHGRTCTYYGADGGSCTETYPAVEIIVHETSDQSL